MGCMGRTLGVRNRNCNIHHIKTQTHFFALRPFFIASTSSSVAIVEVAQSYASFCVAQRISHSNALRKGMTNESDSLSSSTVERLGFRMSKGRLEQLIRFEILAQSSQILPRDPCGTSSIVEEHHLSYHRSFSKEERKKAGRDERVLSYYRRSDEI